MEWWKTSVRAFLGIAIRGLRWRCYPASIRYVPFTVPQGNSPALNFIAGALPATSE
jgi:hypothetical protein